MVALLLARGCCQWAIGDGWHRGEPSSPWHPWIQRSPIRADYGQAPVGGTDGAHRACP
jgi:hypothetical protein